MEVGRLIKLIVLNINQSIIIELKYQFFLLPTAKTDTYEKPITLLNKDMTNSSYLNTGHTLAI
jgi:hypothetical protein